MKLPRWLRRDSESGATAAAPGSNREAAPDGADGNAPDPLDLVRWIPAAENPFGVDVLDCFVFAGSMVATTSSPDIARRFSELRGSSGEQCRAGDRPGTIVPCRLEYPSGSRADGPVFLAQQMEDKWDVFLMEGELCFARSWTGDVVYRAGVAFDQSLAIVSYVSAQSEQAASEGPVAVVDYLMKSHVYSLIAPHPLVGAPAASDKELAYWSFARYGRRGVFGAHGDVAHLRVRRGNDGRCSLMRPG